MHALAISVLFACLIKYVCITICRAHIATPNHVLDAAFAMQLHLCVHVVIKYYTHRSCCRCSNDTVDVMENEKSTAQHHVRWHSCNMVALNLSHNIYTHQNTREKCTRNHELSTTIKSNFKGKSLCPS